MNNQLSIRKILIIFIFFMLIIHNIIPFFVNVKISTLVIGNIVFVLLILIFSGKEKIYSLLYIFIFMFIISYLLRYMNLLIFPETYMFPRKLAYDYKLINIALIYLTLGFLIFILPLLYFKTSRYSIIIFKNRFKIIKYKKVILLLFYLSSVLKLVNYFLFHIGGTGVLPQIKIFVGLFYYVFPFFISLVGVMILLIVDSRARKKYLIALLFSGIIFILTGSKAAISLLSLYLITYLIISKRESINRKFFIILMISLISYNIIAGLAMSIRVYMQNNGEKKYIDIVQQELSDRKIFNYNTLIGRLQSFDSFLEIINFKKHDFKSFFNPSIFIKQFIVSLLPNYIYNDPNIINSGQIFAYLVMNFPLDKPMGLETGLFGSFYLYFGKVFYFPICFIFSILFIFSYKFLSSLISKNPLFIIVTMFFLVKMFSVVLTGNINVVYAEIIKQSVFFMVDIKILTVLTRSYE